MWSRLTPSMCSADQDVRVCCFPSFVQPDLVAPVPGWGTVDHQSPLILGSGHWQPDRTAQAHRLYVRMHTSMASNHVLQAMCCRTVRWRWWPTCPARAPRLSSASTTHAVRRDMHMNMDTQHLAEDSDEAVDITIKQYVRSWHILVPLSLSISVSISVSVCVSQSHMHRIAYAGSGDMLGARLWEGAPRLASALWSCRFITDWSLCTVLELGCGVALPGILCAKMHAKRVWSWEILMCGVMCAGCGDGLQ
jgi:hypothetical protein